MNKYLLTAALLCSGLLSHANDKGVICLTSPANYQVLSISGNGLWACGIEYNEETATSIGFRWNLTTGTIETLGTNTTASSIANDGSIAGSFQSSSSTGFDIEVPGLWKEGKWNRLEHSNTTDAWAEAITCDGKYITGSDNSYTSYIWEEGKIKHTAQLKNGSSNITFMASCVSPDGSKIGGWAYYYANNRNAGYWDASDNKFHPLPADSKGAPWQRLIKFSADGKKALYWGGYDKATQMEGRGNGMRAIYNFDTQTADVIYPTHPSPQNIDFYDMGSNMSIVGMQQEEDGTEYGIICQDGKAQLIEQYLAERGTDFSNLGIVELDDTDHYHYIMRAISISADEQKFALLCYNEDYNLFSVIVMLNQDIQMLPPVGIEVVQQTDILATEVTWKEPLGDISNLSGYNVYRNGIKVNNEIVTACSYMDKGLEAMTYSYTVRAVYGNDESTDSEPKSITLHNKEIEKPQLFMARQRGYNSLYAIWNKPETNLCDLNYYKEEELIGGFGGGSFSFETAVRFPKEQLALYEGHKIAGIAFCPRCEQKSWIINLYTIEEGKPTLLRYYKVNSESLVYGKTNIYYLATQLAIPADKELLVGIQVNVDEENPSYDIVGVSNGCKKIGYSDLLRQVGDTEFISYGERTGEDIAWNTSLLLAPAGIDKEADHVTKYNVFINNKKICSTYEFEYLEEHLSDGIYRIGVQAEYANGTQSDTVCQTLELYANQQMLKSIKPTVKLQDSQMTASWEAPLDDDNTTFGWCGDTRGTKHPALSDNMNSLYVRVDFPADQFLSYEGYQIKELSFYPLAEAGFELIIYRDDEEMYLDDIEEVEVDRWNVIELKEPLFIEAGHSYRYVIYCYDCPAYCSPIAFDNQATRSEYSNLYMAEGDQSWSNADSYSTLYMQGNWMMRMRIADGMAEPFAVSGYDIYVDGALSSSAQTDLTYTHNFSDNGKHSVRVDANYAVGKSIEGETIEFDFSASAIEDLKCRNNATKSHSLDGKEFPHTSQDANAIKLKNGQKRIDIR